MVWSHWRERFQEVFTLQTPGHLGAHTVPGCGDMLTGDTALILVPQGSQYEANTVNYTKASVFISGLCCCSTAHLSFFSPINGLSSLYQNPQWTTQMLTMVLCREVLYNISYINLMLKLCNQTPGKEHTSAKYCTVFYEMSDLQLRLFYGPASCPEHAALCLFLSSPPPFLPLP